MTLPLIERLYRIKMALRHHLDEEFSYGVTGQQIVDYIEPELVGTKYEGFGSEEERERLHPSVRYPSPNCRCSGCRKKKCHCTEDYAWEMLSVYGDGHLGYTDYKIACWACDCIFTHVEEYRGPASSGERWVNERHDRIVKMFGG